MKIRLAVTMGDPGGIGPEVLVKALRKIESREDTSFLVIGQSRVLSRYGFKKSNRISLCDPCSSKFIPLGPTAASGRAAFQCLQTAVELLKKKDVCGVITAPVSKQALRLAGFRWPGHTEFLADSFGVPQVEMVFVSDKLKVALVTRHVSLERAIREVTKERIVSCARILMELLQKQFGYRKPRIAVCGLNPHAGEAGMFGGQEKEEIAPAVRALNRLYPGVFSGPLAADGVFHQACLGAYDMVLCMYHDQGLIPFKMTELSRGVHLTAGLPFARTSPVHGTAYDIAGKNKADAGSMLAALRCARQLALRSK